MDETRMILPDDETPKVRIPKEGEPIPPVDPEDLRRSWKVRPTWSCAASREAQINFLAVSRRDGMIRMLAHFNHSQLLAPWKHGEELDDAVFRIAATFRMRTVRHRSYQIAGDEIFGFDPNAFVQQLIEETGISHTWEPIPTRIHEGGCCFRFTRVSVRRETPDPRYPFVEEGEAKLCAREVLWDAWDRYSHIQPSPKLGAEMHASYVAGLFADFVIDNIDLAQQLTAHFSGGEGPDPSAIVTELERRVKDSILRLYGVLPVSKENEGKPCPKCSRLFKDHSEDEMRTCFGKLIFKEKDNPDQNPA